MNERALYNNLVRRHNAATLIYGDWGSTRPPSDPVPMKNIPRIDLPTPRQWISFRRDSELDDDEDYSDIAKRVVADNEWPTDLNIWGTYTINWTAEGEPGAIRIPYTAAAARINIHLHRQAFFGVDGIHVDGDEPFTDELLEISGVAIPNSAPTVSGERFRRWRTLSANLTASPTSAASRLAPSSDFSCAGRAATGRCGLGRVLRSITESRATTPTSWDWPECAPSASCATG